MKRISRFVVFNVLVGTISIFPSVGIAGDQTGTITEIRVSSPTIANPTHVMLSGTWNSRPDCAISGWWQIDTDTPHGKSMLATLLTAKASGKPVTFWGNGKCTLRTDMEDVLQVGLP